MSTGIGGGDLPPVRDPVRRGNIPGYMMPGKSLNFNLYKIGTKT